MKVLITGAGGFIGSHMVERCIRDGHEVVAVDKKFLAEWTFPDYDTVGVRRFPSFDVSSPDSIHLPTCDVCFHLAAEARIQPSFSSPMLTVLSNTLGTARMLEWARKSGAKMVYAGSSTADSDFRLNVYAASKHAGEDMCRTWARCFGIRASVARFYNVYGPRQIEEGRYATVIGIFEKQLREGKKLTVTGTGEQRRDFTHVDDIVSGLIAVSESGVQDGRPYSLGSGRNYSIMEVAKMHTDETNIEFLPERPGEAWQTLADVTVTREHTGWSPSKRLEDYVRKVVKK